MLNIPNFFGNKKIFLLLITSACFFVSACKTMFTTPLTAPVAYASKQYTVAANLWQQQYDKEVSLLEKSKIAYKIAECYRFANRTAEAEKWYAKALEYASEPQVLWWYAQMQKANGNYTQAIQSLNEYSLNNPIDRTRATREIQACRQALDWQKQPTPYEIVNIKSINSPASDFAPTIYVPKGTENLQVVFTSDRSSAEGAQKYGWTGEKFSDLFYVEQKNIDLQFSDPKPFGNDSLNTAFNEGTICFSNNYTQAYFTACGSADAQKNDYCQIYMVKKNAEGKWLKPEPLPIFDTDTINVGQPFVTPNGAQLYFSADAPNGYGNKDLYVINQLNDGKWSKPQNLGPEINTQGYEGFPYVAPNGKLYFASNGHLGMGGLDIFSAEKKGKNWTNIQNLQAPINSPADDFSLVFEPFIKPTMIDAVQEIGYFASARTGNDDLYRFLLPVPPLKIDTTPKVVVQQVPLLPKPTYILKGKITTFVYQNPEEPATKTTQKQPLPSAITEIFGIDANSKIAKRLIADENGYFETQVEPNTDYKVSASQVGFFAKSENASTKYKSPKNPTDTIIVNVEITLDKIFKQKEITLENIYYDLDKYDIRTDAQPTLNKLATILLENPNIKIELNSHTDSRGSDKYNLTLSQKRADAVVNYLISKGVSPQRLTPRGFGETQLVNNCSNGADCTEEQHQQNRRTTFKVVSDSFGSGGF